MMGGWKWVWKNMFLVLLTQKHVNELKLSTDLKGW